MRKVYLHQPNFLFILNLSVSVTLALVRGAPINYRLLLFSCLLYQRHRRIIHLQLLLLLTTGCKYKADLAWLLLYLVQSLLMPCRLFVPVTHVLTLVGHALQEVLLRLH